MHTDGNSHDLSYFDGQEEYTKVEVTEDTYAEKAAEGLYFFQGAYTVPSGVEKIVFRYYDEDGNVLESDTVPVLSNGEKGDTGPAGEKGSGYRGVYTDTSAIDDAVKGDYILSSTDGMIWQYQLISGELQWKSLTLAEAPAYYNQALNDGINTFANEESNPMMNAITVWCKSLVAQAALINNLFTKAITLQKAEDDTEGTNSGYIKSDNWVQGTKGWIIRHDGNAEFHDVYIGGNADFAGYIASGPLYLDDEDPGSLESQTTFASGTNWETVESYLGFSLSECEESKIYGLYNAKYGDTGFSYLQRTFDTYLGPLSVPSFRTYLHFMNRKQSTLAIVQVWDSNNGYLTTGSTLVFDVYTPGGKTLKLYNLPTSKSTLAGVVYQDTEGYLRISQ